VHPNASAYLALSMRDVHHQLTIPPTTVWADDSLHKVAAASVGNPGARVLSVIAEAGRLVGIIPVATVVEHLLLELGGDVRRTTPDIVLGRKYAHQAAVHQAKHMMYRPVTIRLRGTVQEGLRLMQVDGLEGLPITDEQDRVVGYADQLELLALGIHLGVNSRNGKNRTLSSDSLR
jgi:CBS domain-containing protein